MPWKVNENAAEMYELYQSGVSLAGVAKAYGCTRQSVYGLFMYRGWAIRQKRRPLPYIVFLGCKYTLRNNGYFAKTKGKRTLLHRDVWEYYVGEIPDGYDIHHKDCDRENNKIENLECIPKSMHTSLHSPHHNQYTKGLKG